MKVQPMRLIAPASNGRSSASVAVEAGTTHLLAGGAVSEKTNYQVETAPSKQNAERAGTDAQFRTVKVGSEDFSQKFPPNVVKTSVYTPMSFVPKNLFKQFTRFSNVYFLFITALQLIPEVTSTPGFPTMVVPLVFIIVVSAVRDLIEDLDRHRSDSLQNGARVARLDLKHARSPANCDGAFSPGVCADVRVGDLVRINDNEEVPADIVLIGTSNNHGQCFVMTANLDGESTLKPRYVPAELCIAPFGHDCFSPEGELTTTGVDRIKELEIECEPPSRRIDRFEGSMKVSVSAANEDALDLDINHVLLKGTQLKDTRWVIGIVIYTGDDTRVRQNSSDTPIKQSWLYRFINKITLWVVLAQIAILMVAVLVEKHMVSSEAVWQNPFIDEDVKNVGTLDLIYLFLAYMLLFSNFVPISLQVTIDFTRYFQAKVIQNDLEMNCLPASTRQATQSLNSKQTSVRVQSSELNEELGLVEHIFTDKTGTLTCNRMEFRSCHVDGKTFDFDEERGVLNQIVDDSRSPHGHTAISSFDTTTSLGAPGSSVDHMEDSQSVASGSSSPLTPQMKKFLLNLAINNSISPASGSTETSSNPQRKRSVKDFSGPSPDEKALVAAAARLNVTLVGRDNGHLTVNVEGLDMEIQILHIFEFSSERKKSSIVCRHPDGKIVLYCKGADTVILRDLSVKNHPGTLQQAKDHLQLYSSNGLRVLCIAERELSPDEYATWNAQYNELRTRMKNKSRTRGSDENAAESKEVDAVASIVASLERNLMLIGVSAIEDKIQEDVPQTLERFREAGVKVWMLTGDRPDTATNVAYAVRLISSDMRLIKLTESHWLESKTTALHFFERELKQTQGDAYILTSSFLLPKPHSGRTSIGGSSPLVDSSITPQGPRLAVILSDSAVEAIRDFGLESEFLQLCMRCESVICARISPKQKEFIVGMVRSRYPGKVTMAVGDGANDVPMIQRAHIGVGIAGEEGNQASDSSDYSIPAFRFLQKLVLVHGRSMNRRIAVLTLYIFYKNVLLVLPQFVYGIYCLFSGQSSYYDPLLQLFNICFTSLPVLFFSIFDEDIAAATVLQYPRLYQDGSSHAFLNVRLFVYWMFEATVASILIILIPAKLIPLAPWSGTGKDNDLWSLGLTQNFIVVFLANARLLLETSANHRTMVALTTASVLVWWAVVYVMSSSVSFGREFYGILRVGSLTQLSLCCCFCSALSLFVAFVPRVHEVLFDPKPRTICREFDYITDAKDREYFAKRRVTDINGEREGRAVVVPT